MALIIENPELEAKVQALAGEAGLSAEAYIVGLVTEDEWAELPPDETLADDAWEAADLNAALDEAIEEAERGQTIPASEVFKQLREQYGISG